MGCAFNNREHYIEGYLLDTLSETERDDFAGHLFECDECQSELQFRERISDITSDTVISHSQLVGADILLKKKRAFAIATGLVLMLVSFFTYRLLLNLPPVPSAQAENFQPSPYFEALLNQNWRSTGKGIDSVISPQNYTNDSNNIIFQWVSNVDTPLELAIFNNRDSLVFSSIHVNGFQYTLTNAGAKLHPGRYYWQLDNPSSRIPPFTGCFFINKPEYIND